MSLPHGDIAAIDHNGPQGVRRITFIFSKPLQPWWGAARSTGYQLQLGRLSLVLQSLRFAPHANQLLQHIILQGLLAQILQHFADVLLTIAQLAEKIHLALVHFHTCCRNFSGVWWCCFAGNWTDQCHFSKHLCSFKPDDPVFPAVSHRHQLQGGKD